MPSAGLNVGNPSEATAKRESADSSPNNANGSLESGNKRVASSQAELHAAIHEESLSPGVELNKRDSLSPRSRVDSDSEDRGPSDSDHNSKPATGISFAS